MTSAMVKACAKILGAKANYYLAHSAEGRQKLQKDTEDYSDRHKMAIAWNALSATFNTGMIAIMGENTQHKKKPLKRGIGGLHNVFNCCWDILDLLHI